MDEFMEAMKEVLVDNFNAYGADPGFRENVEVIKDWRESGEITEDQYRELRSFNRSTYSDLPLDM